MHVDENGSPVHNPPHLLKDPESNHPDQVGLVTVLPVKVPGKAENRPTPKFHAVKVVVEWVGNAGRQRIELQGQHKHHGATP